MTYYNKNADGSVNVFTEDVSTAEEFGLEFTTTENIVVAYNGKTYVESECPERPVTVADYDAAMEAHLKAEQIARGYTTRSPNEYANSTNTRWAQDAADWVAHVTAVMEYALDIENRHAAGETVPTLDEFKAALPRIQWTVAAS